MQEKQEGGVKAAAWSVSHSPERGLRRGGGTSEAAAGGSDAVGACCEVSGVGGS